MFFSKRFILVLTFFIFQNASAWMPVGGLTQKRLNLVAGAIGEEEGIGFGDGPIANARFGDAKGMAFDSSGNLYVADKDNHTIRKISPTGMVITLAGLAGASGASDGVGAAARFNQPNGVAVDSSDNLYVADYGNHTIRKITPAGVVSTFAGAAGVTGTTDGPVADARFNRPSALAVDNSGNVYVADTQNRTIRKITSSGSVSTLAGTAGSAGSANGTGAAARFSVLSGIAVDSSGTLYVVDSSNRNIRKVTSDGVVTGLAGPTAGGTGSTDGTGTAARFYNPSGIVVDSSGTVYVADTMNNLIRKITSAGVVTTIAGATDGVYTGFFGHASSDGIGTAARLGRPTGLALDLNGNLYVSEFWISGLIRKISLTTGAVTTWAGRIAYGSRDGAGADASFFQPSNMARDSVGNLYVADKSNNIIRKMTPAGVVSTFAGSPGLGGATDGTGAAARFYQPSGIAIDSSDNVYVSDTSNYTIRKITPAGVVTTFAGTAGSTGSNDGTGTAARFRYPRGLAVDSSGNIYVADSTDRIIRKITPLRVVSTFAGTASISGSTDATGPAASFNSPTGLGFDSSGNLYVTDTNTIRKITSTAVVSTFAGTSGASGSTDGTGTSARFIGPDSLAVDSSDNIYVTDSQTIRKITLAQEVTTLAGVSGAAGSEDGIGAAARLNSPNGLVCDSSGNIYVTSFNNHNVRKITSAGAVSFVAGYRPTKIGSTDGRRSAARFYNPSGVAADSSGNVYVADSSNHIIRKIDSTGVVSTFAGTAGASGSANGTGAAARFNTPQDIHLDSSGNLYVADKTNHLIRKITSAGDVSTLAGSAGIAGSVDDTGTAARFNNPSGLAVDSSGNVYVADMNNHTIRKITSGGVVSTLAGTAGISGSVDDTGTAASFNKPSGVVIDSSDNIYVADSGNHTIRKITSAGVVSTLAGTAGASGFSDGTGAAARFMNPSSVAVDGRGNVYVGDTKNNMIRKITTGGVVTTIAGTAQSPQVKLGAQAGYIFQPKNLVCKNGKLYFTSGHTVLSLPVP